MVKVSVIIPVYNVEKYLTDCLESVLTQTLYDIEVICIDDASPDRSPEILDEYAKRDARVKVLHLPENHQQGYARNRGIELARGTFIYLLDSDDMIAPETLEKLYDCAEKDQLDGIFFDSQVMYENKELERKNAGYLTMRIGKYPETVCTGKDLFECFNRQQEWTCFIQRQFWKREFILKENIQFPEHSEHEDEVFAFEAILTASRVRYLRKPYFIHRYRPNSVMTSAPAPKNFYGYFRCFYLMEAFARERGLLTDAARSNLARIYNHMERLYAMMPQDALVSFLKNDDERKLFHFFAASQNENLYFKYFIGEKLVEQLQSYRKIYIYGTGMIAQKVYQSLIRRGFVIEGFLVTRRASGMSAYQGRPVDTPENCVCPPDAVALIAVSGGYRQEIEENLERNGWQYMYYKEQ